MKKNAEKKLIKIAKNIKVLILDVDGVLTDGGIIIDNKGNELKSFHVRDGHGIKMLIRAGIHGNRFRHLCLGNRNCYFNLHKDLQDSIEKRGSRYSSCAAFPWHSTFYLYSPNSLAYAFRARWRSWNFLFHGICSKNV